MLISEKEFQLDVARYLDMAANGDVMIFRDDGITLKLELANSESDLSAKMLNRHLSSTKGTGTWRNLIGILPSEASLEKAREERLSKI